jgi:hypothetical protein
LNNAEVLANIGDKRNRLEADALDDLDRAYYKTLRVRRGLKKKAAIRRLRIMEGKPAFDVIKWFRERPVRTEDSLTFG